MVNEAGRFPEVCKKSIQAMAADMQGRIRRGFFEEFDFARLSRFTARELEASGRLVEPLYAGPGDRGYRVIGWEEALARVAGALGGVAPEERARGTFFYFSGRSSNEAGFLLQVFARLYGTNNVNSCSYFCHQASGVGLKSVTGSGTATVTLEDVEACDLVFLIGGNPASNHPRFMRTLMDLKRRGGGVIVINPLREVGLVRFRVPSDVRSLLWGTAIADQYVQPHIGGDIAVLAGIAKALMARGNGAVDGDFVARCTEGFEGFRASVDGLEWERLERESGVPRVEMESAAERYARSARTVFAWTMGITHHRHGVQNVQMIANLAMLRGMLGRRGCGLLPLRGHSNVQGIGSMGAVPAAPEAVLKALESRLGVRLPAEAGLDTLACVERAGEGGMRAAWCLGGNLYGSCPDSAAAERALSRVGTTVYLSTTLNTGHVRGRGRETIVLPVLARDEEPEATTQESMFNYVRLSEGGRARHEGPRSEVRVIAEVARRVLGSGSPLDFGRMERHASIRGAIAAVIPGYGAIGAIDATRREFHVEGRVLHEARFPTATGRAAFCAVALPSVPGAAEAGGPGEAGVVRLMTIRSEGQFNTVVYEEEDVYRGQERRDVILMSREDLERLGVAEGDRVSVTGPAGRMEGVIAREADIRAGNAAMYYPEANVLVPRETDPASRTPAFKSVAVRVEKERRLPVAR
jgi:molybdopterin-dependent oxidoreductase alpha subunit